MASYLLTTSDGLILMDALFSNEGYAEYLLENVRRLGLDPADIRYILITHGTRTTSARCSDSGGYGRPGGNDGG